MAKKTAAKTGASKRRVIPVSEDVKAWLEDHRAAKNWSYPDLATEAHVPHSTIYGILRGHRGMSAEVALKLARALRPMARPLPEFAGELLSLAGYAPERYLTNETVVARLQSGRKRDIRVGYIASEPFVSVPGDGREPSGLAVELFACLTAVLNVQVGETRTYTLHQLQRAVQENDIVVSAILPTARRRTYMDFSRHFPFLRISLSGVVSKRQGIEELTVGQLLTLRDAEILNGRRLLLVEGEVGHEFVTTFLRRVRTTLKTQVELVTTIDPAELYDKLVQDSPDAPHLLLADAGTCMEIVARDGSAGRVQPLRNDTRLDIGTPYKDSRGRQYPVLASYPVTFGLPKADRPWRDMVNDAFDSLMSEGLLSVLSIYADYVDKKNLHAFYDPFDEDFPALKDYFANVLVGSKHTTVTADPADPAPSVTAPSARAARG
jgi:hypothetical protein